MQGGPRGPRLNDRQVDAIATAGILASLFAHLPDAVKGNSSQAIIIVLNGDDALGVAVHGLEDGQLFSELFNTAVSVAEGMGMQVIVHNEVFGELTITIRGDGTWARKGRRGGRG